MSDEQQGSGQPLEDLHYSFNVKDAGDVRHMFLTASKVAQRNGDDVLHSVLKAQADMVIKGLHQRDLAEVPDFMGDVTRFHQKFGQEYNGKPRMLPLDLHDFRTKFHEEETTEYADERPALSLAVHAEDDDLIVHHLANQLDAICDSIWVLLGTADVQFGAAIFNAAWGRVVDKNMQKVLATEDPNAQDSGREIKYDIRKPEGWTPPDHRDLVADHAHKIFRKEGTVNPGYESDTRSTL
jgi:predicted HAD superfamily Cof-like phosphohydrolase